MNKAKINIGDKQYNCLIAKTEEERKLGLMNVDNLPPDEGILFDFKDDPNPQMWMKDTTIPLDMIGINEDDEVTVVYPATPKDETLIPFHNIRYILEVNQNSGIKEGDDFEFDDDDLNKYVMKVIGPNGETQFLLQGGERIFSRISTLQLLKWAKKADNVKNNQEEFDKMCIRLGKRIFRELHDQDNRKPLYVQVPEKKD